MEPQIPPQPQLVVDEQLKYYIRNTVKWAKFLAIVGFVITAFILIMAFSVGTLISTLSQVENFPRFGGSAMITIFYLIIAILYFIPCLFLYRFARRTQGAVDSNSQEQLLSGFDHLNRFFKFVGILTLIYLIFMALAVIAVIVGGMFGVAMSGSTISV